MANYCANECLPQILILGHVVALRLVRLGIGVDGYGIVEVRDADAGEDRNANGEDHIVLLLFLLSLVRGRSLLLCCFGFCLCHFIFAL